MAARTRANRLSQTDESTSDAKPRPTSAGFASAIAMAAKTRESRCQAGENTGDTRPRPTSSSSSDVQIPKPVIHSTRTQVSSILINLLSLQAGKLCVVFLSCNLGKRQSTDTSI